jgi:hypothetical protein
MDVLPHKSPQYLGCCEVVIPAGLDELGAKVIINSDSQAALCHVFLVDVRRVPLNCMGIQYSMQEASRNSTNWQSRRGGT